MQVLYMYYEPVLLATDSRAAATAVVSNTRCVVLLVKYVLATYSMGTTVPQATALVLAQHVMTK